MGCRGPTAEEYLQEQRREIDFLTKNLCALMTFLCKDDSSKMKLENFLKTKPDLKIWWDKHNLFDKERHKAAREKLPTVRQILNDLPDNELENFLKNFKKS